LTAYAVNAIISLDKKTDCPKGGKAQRGARKVETMEMKEITLEEVAKNLKRREAIDFVGDDFYLELPEDLIPFYYTIKKKDRDKLVYYGVEIELPKGLEEPDEIAQAFEDCMNLDNQQYREICYKLQGDYNHLVYVHNENTLDDEDE
jgi:hypothetical protein